MSSKSLNQALSARSSNEKLVALDLGSDNVRDGIVARQDSASLESNLFVPAVASHSSIPVATSKLSGIKQRIRKMSSASINSIASMVGSEASPKSAHSSQIALQIDTEFDYLTANRESLQESPSPITPKKLNSLHQAVWSDDIKRVRKLISEKDRDVNKLDSFHRITALHIAAEHNRMEIAQQLLDPTQNMIGTWGNLDLKYANVSTCDVQGRTAFLIAAKCGHVEMARLLFQNNSNINATDLFGCCAMHYAIASDDFPIFTLLLQGHIRLNIVDKSGNSLLHHAIRLSRFEMALQLIKNNHSVHPINSEGRNPLHSAVIKGFIDGVSALCARGAEREIKDIYGYIPVDYLDTKLPSSERIAALLKGAGTGTGLRVPPIASVFASNSILLSPSSAVGKNQNASAKSIESLNLTSMDDISVESLSINLSKSEPLGKNEDWRSESSLNLMSESDQDSKSAKQHPQSSAYTRLAIQVDSPVEISHVLGGNSFINTFRLSKEVMQPSPDVLYFTPRASSTDPSEAKIPASASCASPLNEELVYSDQLHKQVIQDTALPKVTALEELEESDLSLSDPIEVDDLDESDEEADIVAPMIQPTRNILASIPETIVAVPIASSQGHFGSSIDDDEDDEDSTNVLDILASPNTADRRTTSQQLLHKNHQATVYAVKTSESYISMGAAAISEGTSDEKFSAIGRDGVKLIKLESGTSKDAQFKSSQDIIEELDESNDDETDDSDSIDISDENEADVFQHVEVILQSMLDDSPMRIGMNRIKEFVHDSQKQLDRFDKSERRLVKALNSTGLPLHLKYPMSESDIQQIRGVLEQVGTEILNLERDTAKSQSQLNSSNKRVEMLSAKVALLHETADDNEQLRAEISGLRANQDSDELAELRSKLLLAGKDREHLQDCLDEAKVRSDQLFAKVKIEVQNLRVALKNEEVKLQKCNDQVSTANIKIQELVAENAMVKKFADDSEKANSILVNRRNSLEARLKTVAIDLDDLPKGSKSRRASYSSETDQQVLKLSMELAEAKDTITLLSTKAEGFKIEMTEKVRLETRFKELEQIHTSTIKDLKSFKIDFSKHEADDLHKQSLNDREVQSLQALITTLRMEKEILNAKHVSQQSSITKLECAIQEMKNNQSAELEKFNLNDLDFTVRKEQMESKIIDLIKENNQLTEISRQSIENVRGDREVAQEDLEMVKSHLSKQSSAASIVKLNLRTIQSYDNEIAALIEKLATESKINRDLEAANRKSLITAPQIDISTTKLNTQQKGPDSLAAVNIIQKAKLSTGKLNSIVSQRQDEITKKLNVKAGSSVSNLQQNTSSSTLHITARSLSANTLCTGDMSESAYQTEIELLKRRIAVLDTNLSHSENEKKTAADQVQKLEAIMKNSHHQALLEKDIVKQSQTLDNHMAISNRLSKENAQLYKQLEESKDTISLLEKQTVARSIPEALADQRTAKEHLAMHDNDSFIALESDLQRVLALVSSNTGFTPVTQSNAAQRIPELIAALYKNLSLVVGEKLHLVQSESNLQREVGKKTATIENLTAEMNELSNYQRKSIEHSPEAVVAGDLAIEMNKKLSALLREVSTLKEEVNANESRKIALKAELLNTSIQDQRKYQDLDSRFSDKIEEQKRRAFDAEDRFNVFRMQQLEKFNNVCVEKQTLQNQILLLDENNTRQKQSLELEHGRTASFQEKLFNQQSLIIENQFRSMEANAEIRRQAGLVERLESCSKSAQIEHENLRVKYSQEISAMRAETESIRNEAQIKDALALKWKCDCDIYKSKLQNLEQALADSVPANESNAVSVSATQDGKTVSRQIVPRKSNQNAQSTDSNLTLMHALHDENVILQRKLDRAIRKIESINQTSKTSINTKLQKIVDDYDMQSKQRRVVDKQKELNRLRIEEANEKQLHDLCQEVEKLRSKLS